MKIKIKINSKRRRIIIFEWEQKQCICMHVCVTRNTIDLLLQAKIIFLPFVVRSVVLCNSSDTICSDNESDPNSVNGLVCNLTRKEVNNGKKKEMKWNMLTDFILNCHKSSNVLLSHKGVNVLVAKLCQYQVLMWPIKWIIRLVPSSFFYIHLLFWCLFYHSFIHLLLLVEKKKRINKKPHHHTQWKILNEEKA